ncbi:hypothetical protein NP233_g6929 [Leucocoprinus birnbaumii]|uniref:DUF6534 domain-containing protein n=1 Tax=Leucocoprinus birnbaumii TaxID=56174 RepID=A0AAD5VRA3_9AGAR|nr:hypothetical protein NP233_g6929 [Leucocoprinus birnbaumii]
MYDGKCSLLSLHPTLLLSLLCPADLILEAFANMPSPSSTSGPPGAIPPDLVRTSGPLVIAYLLSWGLYGVLAVQVYIYFLAFPRDRAASRWLVGVVFMLETAQVIVIARDMFESFAKGFGDPSAITGTHLTGFSAPIVAGTVGFLVQVFYAYRIKVLSSTIVVPILICVMAVIQCVGALISGVRGFIAGDVRHLDTMADRIGHGLFNATSAACDIVIAVAMAYYLPKLNTGVRDKTQALVRRIIRLVVGTGALTGNMTIDSTLIPKLLKPFAAVVAIIDQVLFEACPHTGYFLVPAFVLGKLYSNSMMVIFNSRVDLGQLREESTINLSSSHGVSGQAGVGGYPSRNVYHIQRTYDENLGGIEMDFSMRKNEISELGHR